MILGHIARMGLEHTLGIDLTQNPGVWANALVQHDILDELTDFEHDLTEALQTGGQARWGNDASWYCEGFAACLWALGLITDQGDRAGVFLGTERFDGGLRRLAGTDNDDLIRHRMLVTESSALSFQKATLPAR